jgi:pimeloyl-ACP methyl ester carboxylesterase
MMPKQGQMQADDGAELFFEDAGDGPALLLLHGLTGTHDDFARVFDLPALRAIRRVVAPDARGHGRSTNPGGRFSFRQCASDVLALLDHLGITQVQAIGASLGAKTLLHVATRAPSRVSAMVLVSAAPRFPDQTRALLRAAAAAPHSAEDWSAMRAQHAHGDAQIEAIWGVPQQFADDIGDLTLSAIDLATIRAKTLIVSGDRDPLYPIELAMELYQGIRDSALYIVPGGGHLPIFSKERAPFVARALGWLGAGPGSR